MYAQLAFIILRRGIPVVFPKYITKDYNLSMHNFNVVTVDCSYMFQSLQSTHRQVASKRTQHKARILQPDDCYCGVTKHVAAVYNCNIKVMH